MKASLTLLIHYEVKPWFGPRSCERGVLEEDVVIFSFCFDFLCAKAALSLSRFKYFKYEFLTFLEQYCSVRNMKNIFVDAWQKFYESSRAGDVIWKI